MTVPFKQIVISYLDKLSFEAEQTQSVNTIIFDNDNLIGHNTDIGGFTKAIKSLNYKIKGKKLGNLVENGKLMFLYQAFDAFKLWHGIAPEINSEALKLLDND